MQQYLPSTDPPMSGHLLCWDTFLMYGLFYHVNAPLMRGHLVNVDRIFWFTVPAKADSNHYFRNLFLKIFCFQNDNGQTARSWTPIFCRRGNAKWACLNLLRIALTNHKKQVKNFNE